LTESEDAKEEESKEETKKESKIENMDEDDDDDFERDEDSTDPIVKAVSNILTAGDKKATNFDETGNIDDDDADD
jgi:hypothetical protein